MELLIYTRARVNPARYRDGDIVGAYSQERVLWTRAQILCKPKTFNTNGLRFLNSLSYDFLVDTSQYLFNRVSARGVERVDLATGDIDLLDDTPNSLGEYIHVEEHLAHCTENPKHLIFGHRNTEVWFGGRRAEVDLETVWSTIESGSDHLKENNNTWRFSERERRTFLCIACQHLPDHVVSASNHDEVCHCHHCTNEIGSTLTRAEFDEDNKIIKKRVCSIPYWDLTAEVGLDVETIRNRDTVSDARKTPEQGRPHLDECVVEDI